MTNKKQITKKNMTNKNNKIIFSIVSNRSSIHRAGVFLLFIIIIAISSILAFYIFSYFSQIVSFLKETFLISIPLSWEVIWNEKKNELLSTLFDGFINIVVTIYYFILNLFVTTIYADSDNDSDDSGSDMDLGSDDDQGTETIENEGPALSASAASPASENVVVQESNNSHRDRGNVTRRIESIGVPELPEGQSELPHETLRRGLRLAANPPGDATSSQGTSPNVPLGTTPSQETSANVPLNGVSSNEEMDTDMDDAMDAFDALVFHDIHARGPIEVRQSVHNLDTLSLSRYELIVLRNEHGVHHHSYIDGEDYLISTDSEGHIRCYKASGVDENGETIYLNEAGIVENVEPYDNSHED